MTELMPGAEPFFHKGNSIGCLLLHGFTATPQEMRQLGRFLEQCGFSVNGVLLAGHGTQVQDLSRTTWHDWHQSAYSGWQRLNDCCTRVFAVGLSLGGALALHLAAHVSLGGVVAMATPLVLDRKWLWLSRVLKRIQPYRKKGPSSIHNQGVLAARVAYACEPTRSLEQVLMFFRHLYDDLPDVVVPTLLMHSRLDTTVDPTTMALLHERLGTTSKQMVWLEKGGHVVTEDLDRGVAYGAIQGFIEQHS